jgi:hypothetical protein
MVLWLYCIEYINYACLCTNMGTNVLQCSYTRTFRMGVIDTDF